MSLERLWAGWRSAYVTGEASEPGCVLCRIATTDDEEAHVIFRSQHCYVVLNAYPYTSGHAMVVPYRHEGNVEDLDDAESADVWTTTRRTIAAVKSAFGAQGLNVGLNLGKAGGAGFPDHLHVHVVPRWSGDTNFMTSLAETRVLPEALPTTAHRLREAWS